ncbi:MAG: NAD-dependent DNA ligase LigA [Bacteroidota bacterium]
MNYEEARRSIEKLTKDINHYNQTFFQEGKSLITDYEFDLLVQQLAKLEKTFPALKKKDSPTQKIGESPSKHFPTVTHRFPMSSLSNTYEEAEIQQFINRVQKLIPSATIAFVCELKLDGVAISLHYHQGILQRLVTRGDGTCGDDITANQSLIQNIPVRIDRANLPEDFYIRGEIVMPFKSFQKLNDHYATKGKLSLANPRNGTSGLLRRKEVDEAIKDLQPLTFSPYSIAAEPIIKSTQEKSLMQLKKWGFDLLSHPQYCDDLEDVISYIGDWEKKKTKLPLAIDGIVVKVNDLSQQAILGTTAKSPRWAVAYKYQPVAAETVLEDVIYQVGRTGVIVPVAQLQPVQLAGTIVKRATLHNQSEIKRLGICRGDHVYIEKGGDIIPKITKVNIKKRKKEATAIQFIQVCPACCTPLIQHPGEAHYYCTNEGFCTPQLKNQLIHFVSRNAMNITFLGAQTIGLLFDQNLVRRPADLYLLTQEKIAALPGFKEKSTHNLLRSLASSKRMPFDKVLFALGIRHVGVTVAEKLAHYFGDIDQLMSAPMEKLLVIREVGDKIAHSLICYFREENNRKHIQKLRTIGLSFTASKKETASYELAGKRFVVSGIFDGYSREDIYQYIQSKGGSIVSAVSKKVDFLLLGREPGPTKLAKASALKVPTISLASLQKGVEEGVIPYSTTID